MSFARSSTSSGSISFGIGNLSVTSFANLSQSSLLSIVAIFLSPVFRNQFRCRFGLAKLRHDFAPRHLLHGEVALFIFFSAAAEAGSVTTIHSKSSLAKILCGPRVFKILQQPYNTTAIFSYTLLRSELRCKLKCVTLLFYPARGAVSVIETATAVTSRSNNPLVTFRIGTRTSFKSET